MISFDIKGNIKPYIAIQSSVEELKAVFVNSIISKTRLDNFNKYIKYSNDLKEVTGGIILKQWINGSFVTKKSNPKDIDFVTFIDNQTILRLGNKLAPFKANGGWKFYGVDAYIIEVHPNGNKLYKFTEADIIEWLYLFSHTKRNKSGQIFSKGFLEINY